MGPNETSAAIYAFTLGVNEAEGGGSSLNPAIRRRRGKRILPPHSRRLQDVSGEAANDDRLVGRESDGAENQGDDRSKRISVIETKRGQAMALSAQLNRFIEGHGFEIMLLPKNPGLLMTIGCRFVERVPGMAQNRVLSRYHLPGKRSKPRSNAFHTHGSSLTRIDSDSAFNFSFAALISLTPALLRYPFPVLA